MSGNIVGKPSVTFNLASADSEVANAPQSVLLVGQYVTAGSGVSNGSWHQNFPNDGSENAKFGRTSMLAAMIRGFKKIAPQVRLDVIALAAGGGAVARVVDINVTGTATEQGTLTLIIGSERLHKFTVAVPNGTTAANVITAAIAAINADADCPFTASVSTTNLRLTADTLGTIPNDMPIGYEASIAGLTFGSVTQSTAGATDPTLTTVLDVVGNTRYHGIVWPYVAVSAVGTFLTNRFNANNAVLDGVAFTGLSSTHAGILGILGTADFNNQSIVFLADESQSETKYLGPAIAEATYLKLAYFAAIRALRLTPDVSISQYVTTSSALDQFGGPALASLPYFNTPFSLLPVPGAGRGFTEIEIDQLSAAGAGIIGQNSAGSAAIAGEIPTTYLTDLAGNSDITWKYLNYVDTASGAREYFHNNVKKRFAQSRLTQGRVQAGRSMANALTIKSYLVKLYNDLASPEFTLVQGGEDAVKFFKDNVNVTIDMALGKATITMKLPIITQLRTIIATVKIDFDINE